MNWIYFYNALLIIGLVAFVIIIGLTLDGDQKEEASPIAIIFLVLIIISWLIIEEQKTKKYSEIKNANPEYRLYKKAKWLQYKTAKDNEKQNELDRKRNAMKYYKRVIKNHNGR